MKSPALNGLYGIALSVVGAAPIQEPDKLPPVFERVSFEEAVSRTESTEAVLVVAAVAGWCQPCKLMNRTTWQDGKVVEWFNEHGLAIQFDVDIDRELSKLLQIKSMPTMIAWLEGREFDRIVGYKSAEEFLAWVKGVKGGIRATKEMRPRAAAAEDQTTEEINARYRVARELVRRGELDKAYEEFVWVWVNSKGVDRFAGVRLSFMAGEMQLLAQRSSSARERFARLRDEAGARISFKDVDPDDLRDWSVLNGVVGESQKTLAWFDRVKEEEEWMPLIRRERRQIGKLLEASGRWADIAPMYPDPVSELRSHHQRLQQRLQWSIDQPTANGLREYPSSRQMRYYARFQNEAGRLYAAMLAGQRESDARRLADEAVMLDESAEMRIELVSWALLAGQPRTSQAKLLNISLEAEEKKSTELLKRRLMDALESAKVK